MLRNKRKPIDRGRGKRDWKREQLERGIRESILSKSDRKGENSEGDPRAEE